MNQNYLSTAIRNPSDNFSGDFRIYLIEMGFMLQLKEAVFRIPIPFRD
jgi:hypothetical protein